MKTISADVIELADYMAEPDEGHKVRPASDWLDAVIARFNPAQPVFHPTMGWHKTHEAFHFRDGETSVWAGQNGAGKSMATGQVALDLCTQGERVCIASLEMKPDGTMQRMSRQAWGGDTPSIAFIRQFHRWTDDRLWLFDHMGSVKPKTMLAVVRYAAEHLAMQHFFIDNLAKCIPGEDDYNAQKDFVNSASSIAQDTGMHVHIVAHTKKPKDEYGRPGKYDIKGSGAITDLVDNVIVVSKNLKKDAMIRGSGTFKAAESNELATQADAFLSIEKQRNGAFEGQFGFWFDGASNQYVEHRGDAPKRYDISRASNVRSIGEQP